MLIFAGLKVHMTICGDQKTTSGVILPAPRTLFPEPGSLTACNTLCRIGYLISKPKGLYFCPLQPCGCVGRT